MADRDCGALLIFLILCTAWLGWGQSIIMKKLDRILFHLLLKDQEPVKAKPYWPTPDGEIDPE